MNVKTRKTRNVLKWTAIVSAIAVFLTGCINPFSESGRGGGDDNTGASLEVTVATLSASSVVPDVASLVVEYTVTLSRDGHSDLIAAGTETSFTFSDVAPGVWAVLVQGEDASGNVVGVGESTVEVTVEGTTSVSVSLSPTTVGTGAIDLTVTWPPGLITELTTATVAPLGGDPVDIAGSITGLPDHTRYTGDHPSGVYELSMLYARDGAHVATLVVAVHVYDNVTTTETLQLSAAEIGQAPAAPTNLHVVAGAWATLTWNDVSPVNDRYEIQRREDGESEWQDMVIDPPLGPTATEYVDNSVSPMITYIYRIRAVNSFGPTVAEDGWVEFAPVTTAQLAAPTLTLPEHPLPGEKIGLSTNRPNQVRYYYTTNGTNPTFTNEVFDQDMDDSGPYTTAVWQFEGIVLNDPGEYEIRVLARSEGWLDSPITTQTVTVSPKWTESDGTWTVNPGISWNDFMNEVVDQTNEGDTITWSGDTTIKRASGTAGTPALGLQHSLTFDAGGHTVILDGSTGGVHWSSFTQPPDGTVVRFQGITIQNFSGPLRGGFLRVPPGVTLELINVRLENNATGSGQASRFAAGGVVANEGGVVVIEDSVLIGNRGLGGGAVASFSGTTIIRRSRFLGNRAWYNTFVDQEYLSGGAILAIGGTVNVADSFFAGNMATSGAGIFSFGGAISSIDGTINVHGSQFVGHSENQGVPTYISGTGTIRISSSAFFDNHTMGYDNPYVPLIKKETIDAVLDIRSSTFVNNTTLSIAGFGIDDEVRAPNLLLVNTTQGIADFHSIYSHDQVDASAVFVALPDKGPDGVWGTDDDVPGDFRLRADADPAIRAAVIDGGDDAEIAPDFADADEDGNVSEDEPYDLAGNPRVQGTSIDIGAVEH